MFLSICTPTFNRAYTLSRTYESLLVQKNQRFEWIIIDDGSSDETAELVEKWKQDKKIRIKYCFQENQGKHIALNTAMKHVTGELFTCLDSDDWFYPDTIDKVYKLYTKIKDKKDIVGIIGLDTYKDRSCVGTNFDDYKQNDYNWIDLIYQHKMQGDKAYFYKTSILKQFDFPSHINNKHMPPSYQLYLISKSYNFILLNEPLKYIEYLEDGISKNKYKKYIIAADNFSLYRVKIAKLIPTMKGKILNAIHYNATQYLGVVKIVPKDFKLKLFFLTFKLPGYLLAKYIIHKNE